MQPDHHDEAAALRAAVFAVLFDQGDTALPRHRHGLDRATVRRRQRARLLVATTRVAARDGFSGLSPTSISREAGVSTKTFYENFASVDEAFLGLFEILDASLDDLERAVPADAPPREAFATLVTGYAYALTAGHPLGRVLVVETLGGSPAVRRRRLQSMEAFADLIVRIAERSGTPVNPRPVIMGILGGCNELAYQALSCDPVDTEKLAADLREYVALIMEGTFVTLGE